MPVNYPKFDQKIQEQINNTLIQKSKTRYGVIVDFDPKTNKCSVMLEDQNSSFVSSVIKNVVCPINNGIQGASPYRGLRCAVGFRDDNENSAYIINYFDEGRNGNRFANNYKVDTGIPRFMVR